MLLQNALTCAQTQAIFGIQGDEAVRVDAHVGRELDSGGDLKHGSIPCRSVLRVRTSAPALAEHVQAVRDELQANLEQLIGIPQNFRQSGIELSAHFDVERLPLRLRQLNRGAGQSVEVDRTLGRR